jgi:hypothetical protein
MRGHGSRTYGFDTMSIDRFERFDLAHQIRGAALGQIPGPPAKCRITGRDMCELISSWMWDETGKSVPPEAIWNVSPTGELFQVFEWYNQARSWQQRTRALPPPV